MKYKEYQTVRERKIDQLIGLIAFPVLNILLLSIASYIETEYGSQEIDELLLAPWVVNGGFVILAFIFRPQIGVGYLASFCITIAGVITLGVLFLAACFTAIIVNIPFMFLLGELPGLIFCLLFPVLFLGGLFFIGRWGVKAFYSWWSSPEIGA